MTFLGGDFIDESESMDYYNDSWWEHQRMEVVEEEDLRKVHLVPFIFCGIYNLKILPNINLLCTEAYYIGAESSARLAGQKNKK